ncbi:hypothetical protein M2E15_1646 [Bacillus mycoides]|nr:hypothetical protein M2E15_1646 [Bacillus mycoides]
MCQLLKTLLVVMVKPKLKKKKLQKKHRHVALLKQRFQLSLLLRKPLAVVVTTILLKLKLVVQLN